MTFTKTAWLILKDNVGQITANKSWVGGADMNFSLHFMKAVLVLLIHNIQANVPDMSPNLFTSIFFLKKLIKNALAVSLKRYSSPGIKVK